jgi:hypothetical protein
MPIHYELDAHGKIRPDPEDYNAVRNKPRHADAADRYRLAQANKRIRLYKRRQVPGDKGPGDPAG